MRAAPRVRFLSAWFCPFAHRRHIALTHCKIPFDFVDALGWFEQDGEWHHWKSEELVAANPQGTVPTLIAPDRPPVYESVVSVELVDALARGDPSTPPLLPEDPWDRAQCRLAAEDVNKRLCSPYYSILVKRDDESRHRAFSGLLESLREFGSQLKGPLFYGDQLSLVDIVLLPHAWRYYVLAHYRGPDFAVPTDDPSLAPFHRWLEFMTALPAVQETLPDKQRYIKHVRKYADATARSQVANAVREGRAAHER